MERWVHLCALVLLGAAFSSASTTNKPRGNRVHQGGRGLEGFQNVKEPGLERTELKVKSNSTQFTEGSQRIGYYNGWPANAGNTGIGPVHPRSNGWPAGAGIGPAKVGSNGWPANKGIELVHPRSNGWGFRPVQLEPKDWPTSTGIGPAKIGSNGWGFRPVQLEPKDWPTSTGIWPAKIGSNGWGFRPVQLEPKDWPTNTGIGPAKIGSNGWGFRPVQLEPKDWPTNTRIGPAKIGSNGWGFRPVQLEPKDWPTNTGILPAKIGSNGWPAGAGIGPAQVGLNGWPSQEAPVQMGSDGWPANAGIGPVQIGDVTSSMHQSQFRLPNLPAQQAHINYMPYRDNGSPNNGPLTMYYVPQFGSQGSNGIPGTFPQQAIPGQEAQGPQSTPSGITGFNQPASSPFNLPPLGPLGSSGPSGQLFPPPLIPFQRFLLSPIQSQDPRMAEVSQQGASQSPPDLASTSRAYISPGTYYPTVQSNPFATPAYFGPQPNSIPPSPAQQLQYPNPNFQEHPMKYPQGNLAVIPLGSYPATGPTSFKKEH